MHPCGPRWLDFFFIINRWVLFGWIREHFFGWPCMSLYFFHFFNLNSVYYQKKKTANYNHFLLLFFMGKLQTYKNFIIHVHKGKTNAYIAKFRTPFFTFCFKINFNKNWNWPNKFCLKGFFFSYHNSFIFASPLFRFPCSLSLFTSIYYCPFDLENV